MITGPSKGGFGLGGLKASETGISSHTLMLIKSEKGIMNYSQSCKLYADDTKVYREIFDIARDTSILLSDLFHLRNWSEVWQVNFNANKCEITQVTHNLDKSVPHYSLVPRGECLSSVSSVKDLGITIYLA